MPAAVKKTSIVKDALSDPFLPSRVVAVVGGLHAGKTSVVDLIVSSSLASHPATPHESVAALTDNGYVAVGQPTPLRMGRWGPHTNDEARRMITTHTSCCTCVALTSSPNPTPPNTRPTITRGARVLLHLLDTPGHCGLFHAPAAAIAAADVTVVVVSLVEGLSPTTEAAIAAAVAATAHIVLVLTDVDRLCLDLRLPPPTASAKINATVEHVNALIRAAGGVAQTARATGAPDVRSCEVSHAAGTVVFAVPPLGFAFSLRSLMTQWYRSSTPRSVDTFVPATAHIPHAWRAPGVVAASSAAGGAIAAETSLEWWSMVRRLTSEQHCVDEDGVWYPAGRPTAAAAASGTSTTGFTHCIVTPLWKALAATIGACGDELRDTLADLGIPSTAAERRLDTDDMLRTFIPRFYGCGGGSPLVDAIALGPDARIGPHIRWSTVAVGGRDAIARAVRGAARRGGGGSALRLLEGAAAADGPDCAGNGQADAPRTTEGRRWRALPPHCPAAVAAAAGAPLVAVVIGYEGHHDDDGPRSHVSDAAGGTCARPEPLAIVRVISGVLEAGLTVALRADGTDDVAARITSVAIAGPHCVKPVGRVSHRTISVHANVDAAATVAAAADESRAAAFARRAARAAVAADRRAARVAAGDASDTEGSSNAASDRDDAGDAAAAAQAARHAPPPRRVVAAPRALRTGIAAAAAALRHIPLPIFAASTDPSALPLRDPSDPSTSAPAAETEAPSAPPAAAVDEAFDMLRSTFGATPWTRDDVAVALAAAYLVADGGKTSSVPMGDDDDDDDDDDEYAMSSGCVGAGHVALVGGLAAVAHGPYGLLLDVDLAHATSGAARAAHLGSLRLAHGGAVRRRRAPGAMRGVDGDNDAAMSATSESDGDGDGDAGGRGVGSARDAEMAASRAGALVAAGGVERRILRGGEDDDDPPRLLPLQSRIAQRVFGVEVEPRRPSDLPTLLSALRRLRLVEPGVAVTSTPGGAHRVDGTCEAQLDIALATLHAEMAPLLIRLTVPSPVFRESVAADSAETALRAADPSGDELVAAVAAEGGPAGLSARLREAIVDAGSALPTTAVGIAASPLEPSGLVEALERATVVERMASRGPFRWRTYTDVFGWDADTAASLWTCGPAAADGASAVLLCDVVKVPDGTPFAPADGAVCETVLRAARPLLCSAFEAAVAGGGPLMRAPLRGVAARLQTLMVPALDPAVATRSGPFAFLPTTATAAAVEAAAVGAMQRAVDDAVLSAQPRVLEPLWQYTYTGPPDALRTLKELLGKRRCHILASYPVAATPLSTVVAVVPVLEAFGLEATTRVATHGMVYPHVTFAGWGEVPGDPLDRSIPPPAPLEAAPLAGLGRDIVTKVRRRKVRACAGASFRGADEYSLCF